MKHSIYIKELDNIINKAVNAVHSNYSDANKLEGSLYGLELCRDKSLSDIGDLLVSVKKTTRRAMQERHTNYWFFRCCETEMEFVYNKMYAMIKLFNGVDV